MAVNPVMFKMPRRLFFVSACCLAACCLAPGAAFSETPPVAAPPIAAVAAAPARPALSPAAVSGLNDELFYRINFGSADDIKVLLERGANANAKTPQGDPALFIAIDRNDAEAIKMLQMLLDHGANPNVADSAHNYPIISAAKKGQSDMVLMLLAKGASPYAKSLTGATLVEIVKKNCSPKTLADIQVIIDKENAYEASLRAPDRLNQILELYSYQSCLYQYWGYFIGTKADPSRNEEVQKKESNAKEMLAQLTQQVELYFAGSVQPREMQNIADDSIHAIYNDLDGLISNRNRAERGFGSDKDAEKRCNAIAHPPKETHHEDDN